MNRKPSDHCRIGFIAPALDLNREGREDRVFRIAPLTFPLLAALTPAEFDIDVTEERLVPVDFNAEYDLVGITAVTPFAPRAYRIADEFRQRGVPVVIGGPHSTVLPDEAIQHADAVVIGEAYESWPRLLVDLKNGQLQRFYQPQNEADISGLPPPRMDILPNGFTFRYSTFASLGCVHSCEFCFVNGVNSSGQRWRPIADVVRDVELMLEGENQWRWVVFWDDNIVGDPRYTKELCRALIPLQIKWASAATTAAAHDDELLNLLGKSGCIALFIGIESCNQASLKGVGKYHNRVAEMKRMVRRLHDHGISLTGAMVFGFDEDDPGTFDRTLEFALDIDLDLMTPAILTPLPGTRLHQRFEHEGRILDRNWEHYDYFHVVYQPKLMARAELYERFLKFNRDFFSWRSVLSRLSRSRLNLALTLAANSGYRRFHSRMRDEYAAGLRTF